MKLHGILEENDVMYVGPTSVACTIYHMWEYFILRGLFPRSGLDSETILGFFNSQYADDFYYRLYYSVQEEDGKMNRYCSAKGCKHDFKEALFKAVEYLEEHLGPDMDDWHWSRLHAVEYPHAPFSKSKWTKPIFHRKNSQAGGTRHSVRIGFYIRNGRDLEDQEENFFEGSLTANFKMLADMSPDGYDKTDMSIDAGQSESILSRHYFDLNMGHTAGTYLKISDKTPKTSQISSTY